MPQGFLIFLDLDPSSERMALAPAHSQMAQIVRDSGHTVLSSGVVSANVRAALDRQDFREIRRNGVGYIVLGTANGTLSGQVAYGSTYYIGQVTANLELVRMSDGAVAATGSGSAKSRGMSDAQAALNNALATAVSSATRELMRNFSQP